MPMLRAGFADLRPTTTASEPKDRTNTSARRRRATTSSTPCRRRRRPRRRLARSGWSMGTARAAWPLGPSPSSSTTARSVGYLGAVAVAAIAASGEVLFRRAIEGGGVLYRLSGMGDRARSPSFSKPIEHALRRRPRPLSRRHPRRLLLLRLRQLPERRGGSASVLKAGWPDTPAAQRFFRETEIGAAPIEGSLLVIAGEGDQTVPIASVRATVAEACRRGVRLEFKPYPGLDHDPTMTNSTPDQLAWIHAVRTWQAGGEHLLTRNRKKLLPMTDWTSGYVADVNYSFGYYPESQSSAPATGACSMPRLRRRYLGRRLRPRLRARRVSVNIHAAAASDTQWWGTRLQPCPRRRAPISSRRRQRRRGPLVRLGLRRILVSVPTCPTSTTSACTASGAGSRAKLFLR